MKHWSAGFALLLAPLFVVGLALAQGWGWTPGTAPPTVPPSAISVRFGTALQPLVDALPSTGGILQLDPGRFYANATDSTIALTLNKPVTIIGQSFSGTLMASPVLIQSSDCHLEKIRVRPTAGAYGIKLFNSGNTVTRCSFNNVYVGGDSVGDPNVPVIGVWMDGAILTTFDQCTIAYNSGDGLYAHSTVLPLYSTNQNAFINCTFNGNGWYGIDCGGGINWTSFIGGNVEANVLGGVRDSSCVEMVMEGVDFEGTNAVSNVIFATSCVNFRLSDCNFSHTNATRMFLFSSCSNVVVNGNHLNHAYNTAASGTQYGAFDESSTDCREWNNAVTDSNIFINNRSRQNNHDRTGASWQPPLAQMTNVAWWVPQAAAGDVGLIGNWATNDGARASQNPITTDLGSQMRRLRWTRTADNQNMGPTAFSAAECQFWRGDKQFAGGFYFSATFRIDAAGSIAGGGASTKMFVGLAENGAGLMTAPVDSSGLAGNFIGLYRDGQDKNVFRLVYGDGGSVTKTAFTAIGGAANMQYATGEAYQFEIWCPAKGGTIYTKLTSINRHSACGFAQTSAGPTATTLMGPQCLMGTGTGGACSFSVANVYVSR